MEIIFWFILANVIVHGVIAGLSFDVATVKLPTRRRIGAVAYANFARGNDLGNGVIIYPALGITALVLVVCAGVAAYVTHAPLEVMIPLGFAGAGTIAHTLCTVQAAPIMISLKSAPDDEKLLAQKLDRFAFWHNLRAGFQFVTFAAFVWALVEIAPAV